uniref:Protein FAM161A n=1 Tax=Neogobius melanostomus TaxID=47308 RepID=A0A8C6SP96_9GOBI
NLSYKIFFSNEEYYSKLEELKKAHLRTMAELESMYRRKLQLKSTEPLESATEAGMNWSHSSPLLSRGLKKSLSAVELRYGLSDSSDEEGDIATSSLEKGLQFCPKEHIKNMWLDFKLSPPRHRLSSSLRSLPWDQTSPKKVQGQKRSSREKWKHRVTVPEPFHMMVREDERRKRGVKSRSEIEHENADLKRQLEELTECQRKFRASPVPAHVHLPLFEELQEKSEERRKIIRDENYLKNIQKPFSFIERERLKKEQRQQQKAALSGQEKVILFKAKPVPKAVYAAATGEQMKEEQLYRSIKMQMRAQELLSRASMPPSMLTRRLSERKKTKDDMAKDCTHQPKINKEIPDFEASYRRFKKHLEKRKEVKPTTSCEPFQLKTAQIPSHRERILAEIENEHSSPRALRWPFVSPEPSRTPTSSLCSSLSGSTELLSTKSTSEEQWREKQRQREKRLQTVVMKRAQANDPHVSLSQTQPSKLQEFR